MLDMIKPKEPNRIRLSDLKNVGQMAAYFFDTFMNVDKYLEHEQRDPNAAIKVCPRTDDSDWSKLIA